MKESPMIGETRHRHCAPLVLAGCLFLLLSLLHGTALSAQKCRDSIIASTPESSFIPNNDGTVFQKTTGLEWMRCSLGQGWDGRTCTGTAASFRWSAALKAATQEKFAGYEDWRLPNKNELAAIVEERCVSPAINSTIFPGAPGGFFWSSSPYSGLSTGAWSVDFGYGVVTATDKSGELHVRLVRDIKIADR